MSAHIHKVTAAPELAPIRNKVMAFLFRVIPGLMLVFLPLIVWPGNPLNIPGLVMFYTGYIAAGVALVVFQVLLGKIFANLVMLEQRGIFNSSRHHEKGNLHAALAHYKSSLADRLNHRNQWIMSIGFVVLISSWYFYRRPISSLGQHPILIVGLVVEMLISFLIGFLAWRMLVIGWEVWNLPAAFKLKLNVLHPDKCGGLEPLGDLCLWNALIISCAGIYIGGWLAVGSESLLWEQAEAYRPVFQMLLIIPIFMACVCFFLPLWKTHLSMVENRKLIQIQLDELAQKIFVADSELLELADQLAPDQAEQRMKNLETMRGVYSKYQYIPVWPINLNLFSRFCLSQAVPVLSLLGISQPIMDAIGSLIKLIEVPGS